MDKNKIIGKEVWVLEEKNHSWKPDKTKTWKVKEYIDWGDERLNGDFCPHVILEDAEGNTKEVREWEVTIVPDTNLPEIDMINRFLSDNGIYNDDISQFNEGAVSVSISWGDWKHEHGYLRNLMQYIDYKEVGESVTEENGSDCYSSIHYFTKEVA